MMEGLGADSEEKHEPVSDIDTVTADSLKALDPNRPIREADIAFTGFGTRLCGRKDEVSAKRRQCYVAKQRSAGRDALGRRLRQTTIVRGAYTRSRIDRPRLRSIR